MSGGRLHRISDNRFPNPSSGRKIRSGRGVEGASPEVPAKRSFSVQCRGVPRWRAMGGKPKLTDAPSSVRLALETNDNWTEYLLAKAPAPRTLVQGFDITLQGGRYASFLWGLAWKKDPAEGLIGVQKRPTP